jgi:twitching motility protein PilT
MSLKEWIAKARALGASDVHVECDAPVVARVRSELKIIAESAPGAEVVRMAQELLGAEAWEQLLARGSADLSLVLGAARCRLNLYRTVRGLAIAARLLAPAVNDLRACNLHPELRRLTEGASGLVVIAGPTGSGKSTTLAALIEEINAAHARHIITLESPLEYAFANRRSYIRQREIPTHSPSFEQALIDAVRENPDVLVVTEMRTPEVIRLTLNAAETGHLVLATLHSSTCAEALTRICMSFPAEIQGSIRAQLADCLRGVVCQRLEFLEAQQLRVPQCEILLASTAARGTIRAGQLSQIPNVIQSGGEDGMWSFDRYQRWIEAKSDWVVSAPRSSAADPTQPVTPPTLKRTATIPPRTAPARSPARPAQPSGEGPIEISIDEDLSLAELAKKIEEKAR